MRSFAFLSHYKGTVETKLVLLIQPCNLRVLLHYVAKLNCQILSCLELTFCLVKRYRETEYEMDPWIV